MQPIFVTVGMRTHTEKAVDTHDTFRFSIHRVDELSFIDPSAASQGSLLPESCSARLNTYWHSGVKQQDFHWQTSLLKTCGYCWPDPDSVNGAVSLWALWLLSPSLNLLWRGSVTTLCEGACGGRWAGHLKSLAQGHPSLASRWDWDPYFLNQLFTQAGNAGKEWQDEEGISGHFYQVQHAAFTGPQVSRSPWYPGSR